MTHLIVNADDFGLSQSVNQGIIAAHRKGIVTSTSIIANSLAFNDALNHLTNNPKLGVGIHLNILRGKPISNTRYLSTITKKGFFFIPLSVLPFILTKQVIREIEIEYRAQIEKILKNNVNITHIDSEKHHHCIPTLFKLVATLASEYKISGIRLGNEKIVQRSLNLTVLQFFTNKNINTLKQYKLKHSVNQIGISITGKMEERDLISLLNKLPEETTELCTHPGFIDLSHKKITNEFGKFYIDQTREKEVAILTGKAVKNAIKRKKIKLINYMDL